MNKKPQLVDNEIFSEKAGLVHRVLQPDSSGPYTTAVLIHGHLGNEDVMWIFAQTLPPDWLIVTPRAIIPVAEKSFTWHLRGQNEWPTLDQYDEAVTAVIQFIHALPDLYNADLAQVHLMGFSQGAATAFATAVHYPGWIKSIASLVGFMPFQVQAAIENAALQRLPVFMAAGKRDKRIPLQIARDSAEAVRAMGANLAYREYDTGHKLNAEGMRKLKAWWVEREAFQKIHTET